MMTRVMFPADFLFDSLILAHFVYSLAPKDGGPSVAYHMKNIHPLVKRIQRSLCFQTEYSIQISVSVYLTNFR